MKRITRTIIVAAALAAALLIACGEEDITDPEGPRYFTPASPVNVLRNVEKSFRIQGFNGFRDCLSPDFVFYFNPNDVGEIVEGYKIPVSWNRVEMLAAIRKMFNQAYGIEMVIPTNGVGTPGSEDTTWRVDNVTITLVLLTEPGVGYRIGAGYCNFEFERYENDGDYRWRLTTWWDYTSESRDGEPASLGRVLAVYK
jgi:hypothetical protein